VATLLLSFAIIFQLWIEVSSSEERRAVRRRKLVSDVENVVSNINQKIYSKLAEERKGTYIIL